MPAGAFHQRPPGPPSEAPAGTEDSGGTAPERDAVSFDRRAGGPKAAAAQLNDVRLDSRGVMARAICDGPPFVGAKGDTGPSRATCRDYTRPDGRSEDPLRSVHRANGPRPKRPPVSRAKMSRRGTRSRTSPPGWVRWARRRRLRRGG